jgi:glutathione peroxidase
LVARRHAARSTAQPQTTLFTRTRSLTTPNAPRASARLALATVLAGPLGWATAQGQAVAPKPAPVSAALPCPALLQHSFARLQDDKPQPLCQYAGKVVLVVNTASYCGYTNQYEGLEALHARFAAEGLVVMGFPTNDFGQQAPGNAKQIAELCFNTYGVCLPMFSKTTLKGKDANPLFAALATATGTAPAWNFHKHLVDHRGLAVASFKSETTPTSSAVVAAIEKALAAP